MRPFTILLLTLVLSACVAVPSTALIPPSTVTIDPCSSNALPGEVDKVHKLLREFDDASLLATNTPRDQLPPVISDMQGVRRAAEDQIVPPCLGTLKQLLLRHMNTVISTLVAFLGGADQTTLNQGAELARQQHNDYALEYARLLGLTVVVPASPTPDPSLTNTPVPPTPIALGATNSTSANINLYADPSADSTVVAVLFTNQAAHVLTQTPDGQWFKVEVPGQIDQSAWVQASFVTLAPLSP